MKVLIISTDRSVLTKESAFRARLMEYQKRLGHITVLTLDIAGREDIAPGLQVIGIQRKTKLATLRAAYREASLLVAHDASWVVTTQDEFTGIIGYLLAKRFGIVWRAEIHTDILSPWFGRVFFKNTMRKIAFRVTIKKASCIRVVSERIKRGLIERHITRAPIVVLPVKPQRPTGGNASGTERFFLVLSRLTYEKNIAHAIRAFQGIAERFPDILLKIVGDGPQKTILERQASDLGIRNRVVFLGWQQETAPLLSGAVALLSPSWYEGFGLSVVEAMSVGCPVITTDVGIVGDILKHDESGIVVEHNDKDGMTDAMMRLIKDDAYRTRLGVAAKIAVGPLFDEAAYWRVFDESFSLCKTQK